VSAESPSARMPRVALFVRTTIVNNSPMLALSLLCRRFLKTTRNRGRSMAALANRLILLQIGNGSAGEALRYAKFTDHQRSRDHRKSCRNGLTCSMYHIHVIDQVRRENTRTTRHQFRTHWLYVVAISAAKLELVQRTRNVARNAAEVIFNPTSTSDWAARPTPSPPPDSYKPTPPTWTTR
jgi:hypothetical protein